MHAQGGALGWPKQWRAARLEGGPAGWWAAERRASERRRSRMSRLRGPKAEFAPSRRVAPDVAAAAAWGRGPRLLTGKHLVKRRRFGLAPRLPWGPQYPEKQAQIAPSALPAHPRRAALYVVFRGQHPTGFSTNGDDLAAMAYDHYTLLKVDRPISRLSRQVISNFCTLSAPVVNRFVRAQVTEYRKTPLVCLRICKVM